MAEIAAAALKLTGALEAKPGADGVKEASSGARALQEALPAGQGMTKIFLNVGRAHKIRPNDVVGAIANEAGLPGEAIGAIDIYEDFTLVDIPQKEVAKVTAALQRSNLRGHRVKVEIASGKKQGAKKARS